MPSKNKAIQAKRQTPKCPICLEEFVDKVKIRLVVCYVLVYTCCSLILFICYFINYTITFYRFDDQLSVFPEVLNLYFDVLIFFKHLASMIVVITISGIFSH